MSDSSLVEQLFAGMKGAAQAVQQALPGLQNFVPEVGAEVSRLGTQGTMELASALFNGNAFVPYGPGQYTPSADPSMSPSVEPAQQPESPQLEQDRGGMER